MKKIVLIVFLFSISAIAYSQGEIAETEKIFIKNESVIGINVASNGFGLNYRYAKRVDAFRKKLFEIEASLIKHPKEIKILNPNFESQDRFVFGKLNEVGSLKFGYGRQREIYSKFDKGSISIKFFYHGGISLALLKPIYYEMIDSTYINQSQNLIIYYVGTHKFNPSLHKSIDVVGKAPFKMGLNETRLLPGVYGKCGYSFEYGTNDTIIRAIEVGVAVEAYSSRLELMAIDNNPRINLSLFFTVRFGRVLDGKKKPKDRSEGFFKKKKKQAPIGDTESLPVIKEEQYPEND